MNAFAEPVVIIPAKRGGSPYVTRGDFRSPTTDIVMDDSTLVTASPTLGIRASEIANQPWPVRKGDELYIRVQPDPAFPTDFPAKFVVVPGATRMFSITEVRPDGQGDVKLVLEERSSV